MAGNAAAALQGAPVTTVDIDADLADIIKRKRAAGRPSVSGGIAGVATDSP
jgi:hypothetical protein